MRRAATKALPSQGYLRSRLDYDAETALGRFSTAEQAHTAYAAAALRYFGAYARAA